MSPGVSKAVGAAIELRGVGMSFATVEGRAVRALDGIDLAIGAGTFVSLIGPSGCGKTSLLKIIDGLAQPTEGTVLIDGRPSSRPGPERAVVFQSFALLPWRTVFDNVAFGLRLRGAKRAEVDATVARFISMVGLTGFECHFPSQLSGGMQQRVGIARALAVDPSILLMDEPFGALDAQTRNLLQGDLERIWEADAKTVVFVTHAMDEAVFLSDKVVVMSPRPGRISEVIDVDLPRPRSDATRRDPRFVDLTAYIWDSLRRLMVAERPVG